MADKYIRIQDAINVAEQANGNVTWAERDDCKKRLEQLKPADVISKADMLTMLEETEKEITKGVEASPTGMMIKSVFGVIKCKVNMLGENHG